MDKLMTVRDAMEIIPLGKTKVTAIINSIPHINTGGKLLFRRHDLDAWIALNMVTGKPPKEAHPTVPKRKRLNLDGLTEDGLIPYRKRRA